MDPELFGHVGSGYGSDLLDQNLHIFFKLSDSSLITYIFPQCCGSGSGPIQRKKNHLIEKSMFRYRYCVWTKKAGNHSIFRKTFYYKHALDFRSPYKILCQTSERQNHWSLLSSRASCLQDVFCKSQWGHFLSLTMMKKQTNIVKISVPDPDPPDPRVFCPPGSGSTSQRYGSGSGSFYHHAKIIRKILNPTILWLFLTFYLWKIM